MYIRFSVPVSTSVLELEQIVQEIGRIDLKFKDMYFYADVPSNDLWKIARLKDEGRILGLWFVHYIDDFPAGIVSHVN